MERKLRMGLVGGGPGAFIGPVHKMAAELDGKIELAAGAFSQSAERSRAAGAAFGIDPARAYPSYGEMMQAESRREDGIDFVVIATPNHLHLPVAEAALAAGIAVMSDKPATATYDEVLKLEAAVAKAGLPYGLTHTYAGYALVREARALCASGKLGPIRKVAVEYLQGWLSRPLEATGQKQAAWRSDPALNGPGGCIGDIGTHAFHLTEYVTGLKVTSLNATLRRVVPGRKLDDDCNALLRLQGGASGVLMASQVAAGERNGLRLRVYGENGSLEWGQEDPNRLSVKWLDGPEEIRHAAGAYLGPDALAVTRLPGGHPEGYIEAFAVLYREFAETLTAWKAGKADPLPATLPGIEAGVRGMRFIERAIESDRTEGWVEF
ncbi:MAG: Gfo/Idh/MocA family oxidoreductase [Terracidiphilus sp.]|nr:Gfo/Idh/MocA family oxidoreductase [Terracidiphilus sp.]